MRTRNQLQISQLLNLAILLRNPREMRRPDEPPVAGLLEIGDHVGEGPVERPGVYPDHAHALLNQPQRALATQARLQKIFPRPPALVRPGVDQHYVARLSLVVD